MAPFTFPTESVTFGDLLLRNEYVLTPFFFLVESRVESDNKRRQNTELKPVLHVSDAPSNAVFPSVAICKLLLGMSVSSKLADAYYKVSCCDFRFNPEELFQINKGGKCRKAPFNLMRLLTRFKEAFLFSTVGGNVKPCLNDLLFLETLLGNSMKEIIIIHHEGV